MPTFSLGLARRDDKGMSFQCPDCGPKVNPGRGLQKCCSVFSCNEMPIRGYQRPPSVLCIRRALRRAAFSSAADIHRFERIWVPTLAILRQRIRSPWVVATRCSSLVSLVVPAAVCGVSAEFVVAQPVTASKVANRSETRTVDME